MNLLAVLWLKDLRRAWRNPTAFLIHLAMPILITALIGLAFGRSGQTGGLGKIQLGIVDEDDSAVTRLLRGGLNQGEGSKHLQPHFLAREEAMRRIEENQLGAVVVLPRGFTADYLSGARSVTLELIKNPAQSFHPAVVEELMAALATGLNAVGRNFRPELLAWREALERSTRPSPKDLGNLVERTGARLEAMRQYVVPPRVTYEKSGGTPGSVPSGRPAWNVFASLLPGLAAMFLLFIADNAIRDLYREQRFRTFDRFRSLHTGLFVFVAAKGCYALTIVLLCGAILFGGGALLFGVRWAHPLALGLLLVAYGIFAVGCMAAVSALAGSEKRADTLNTVAGMGLGLAGGCMFPRDQLPAVFRDHLTPLMPTHWFAAAAQRLEGAQAGPAWGIAVAGLACLGVALVAVSAWLYQRRLSAGDRG